MGGKIKIKETFEPLERPGFEEWNKELKSSEMVYLYHPEAKAKADKIMEDVGIEYDCRTVWEIMIGSSIEESINYILKPIRLIK